MIHLLFITSYFFWERAGVGETQKCGGTPEMCEKSLNIMSQFKIFSARHRHKLILSIQLNQKDLFEQENVVR